MKICTASEWGEGGLYVYISIYIISKSVQVFKIKVGRTREEFRLGIDLIAENPQMSFLPQYGKKSVVW